MTLDEAITSCMEVVSEEMESYREICPTAYVVSPACSVTAAVHSQLAEWLTELKWRRKQPEVRHGRWILEREPDGTPYCLHCSECDPDFAVMYNKVATDYCPDCGAKMETDRVYERDDSPDCNIIARHYSEVDVDTAMQAFRDIPAVNRWIPCSERLPVDREAVLTYDAGGNVRKCEYFAEFKKFKPEFSEYYAMAVSYVTHWMPMPEPPKGDEVNDGSN